MENLASYLNDHLAGSVAALELLDRLIKTYAKDPFGPFFRDLRDEIASDQDKLKQLIDALDAQESLTRKVGAWFAEKLSRAKIQLDDSTEGEMGLFLALEALFLGVTGKIALWNALASVRDEIPALSTLDYAELENCALAQRQRIENKRLEIARQALSQRTAIT